MAFTYYIFLARGVVRTPLASQNGMRLGFFTEIFEHLSNFAEITAGHISSITTVTETDSLKEFICRSNALLFCGNIANQTFYAPRWNLVFPTSDMAVFW